MILGCAGLSGYRVELEQRTGLPVVEPVEAGCWQLRTLVEMGLKTSRAGLYGKPPPKTLTDLEQVLAPSFAAWLARRAHAGFAAGG